MSTWRFCMLPEFLALNGVGEWLWLTNIFLEFLNHKLTRFWHLFICHDHNSYNIIILAPRFVPPWTSISCKFEAIILRNRKKIEWFKLPLSSLTDLWKTGLHIGDLDTCKVKSKLVIYPCHISNPSLFLTSKMAMSLSHCFTHFLSDDSKIPLFLEG